MKAFLLPLLAAGLLGGLLPDRAAAQPGPPADDSTNLPPPQVEPAQEPVLPPDLQPPEDAAGPDVVETPEVIDNAPQDGDSASPNTRPPSFGPPPTARSNDLPAPPAQPLAEGQKGLRLNFRGVPLDMVLNYLSDAAGFIINLETEVRGRVDVWSNQSLSKEEAVTLLDTVLSKNGYAAIRSGRTLTIVSRDQAKTRAIPVVSGSDPNEIPQSDEIVTQILPVRFISATQLVKDLQALIPPTASLTANEGGNALVLTDSQSNIRRMAEIIQALDQAIASVSTVRVFPLRYADAKALATEIGQIFQPQETSRNSQDPRARFMARFGGPGGGQPGDSASPNGGRAPTPRVVAVADERSNAVVVSAPEEQMIVIASIVQEVDVNVEDITELRVFRLRHADPQETADLINNLFEESSSSQNNGRNFSRFRFGGPGGPFGGRGGNNNSSSQSERTLKQTAVNAVPDLRTGSVVVSAARDLMVQIGGMIAQLDEDPARKQKVFVYSVENSDPQAVQEVLQSLFPEQNLGQNRNSRTTQRQNNSALSNRQTQNRNQSGTRNTRTGNSNLGNAFGGGGQ